MKTQFLTLPGGTIAYDDTGSGPLVVCVPGMGDVRGEFRLFAPALASAGYRVVTMDLRGHGESSAGWPDYTVESLAADILALVRALGGGPAVIAGSSVSAGAAILAAAEGPEWVAGLLLLGPATRGEVRGFNRLLYSALFSRPWGPALWKMYYKILFPSRKPEDLEGFSDGLRRMLGEPGRMAALRRLMLASQMGAARAMPSVTAPALVIMGSRDPDFKDPEAEARAVAGGLRGEYRMVDGAGHYPHTERPDITFPAALTFLETVTAQSTARAVS